MAVLNLRLGFWLPHPLRLQQTRFVKWMVLPRQQGGVIPGMGDGIRLAYADERTPDFVGAPSGGRLGRLIQQIVNRRLFARAYWRPGPAHLIREATRRFGEADRMVNVSDGGHIENLGLVELIRRRCRIIIAGDGGADPEYGFRDLQQAIALAREQFDVHIDIDMESRYHTIGRITYPPLWAGSEPEVGTLLYMKASISGGEPRAVVDYARENSAFPHESTTDQFFSQAQFDAYYALGRHIATTALGELQQPDYATLESFLVPG